MKICDLLLCTLCVFVVAARADAITLYGATAGSGPGELYILDPATGGIVQDIGPLNDASALNYNMTGLVFDPVSGLLYGSTGASGANPQSRKAPLVTINPATALVTVMGPFTTPTGTPANTMTDLAVDPISDKLYGIGSVGGAHLYDVDKSTGHATMVGDSGFGFTTGGGVAVSSAGIVYGSPDASHFGTYDKTTGAYTQIADPGPEPLGGGGYGALDFDSSGVLYGVNVSSGQLSHLVTIDLATAAVTDLGATVGRLDAIAFQTALPGDYNHNGVVDGADYVVWRKGLGTTFTQSDYNVWRAHFGQTAGSGAGVSANVAVPEPASLLQIILVAAVASTRRRRGG